MIELFVFQVNEVNFALPIKEVLSVHEESDFDNIDSTLKIANIRNEVYALVDLGQYFYGDKVKGQNYLLVKDEKANKLALKVDAILGIIEVREDAKIKVSPLLKHSHILYHIRYDGKLINVVKIDIADV